MKKVLLIMLMAVTSMMASADVGEWSRRAALPV